MRTRVARALYTHQVERARGRASAIDLQPDRLKAVLETARAESDRSAAILTFALAEDLMLEAFKRELNGDVKGGWAELTGGNGLLATANDRITLLYMLNWIELRVYDDLRLLKSIRNRFAHHADVLGFDDKQVQSWIGTFSITEKHVRAGLDPEKWPDRLSSRQLYLIRSALVVTRLMSSLAVLPAAVSEGVHPRHIVGANWDDQPENIKEMDRISADAVIAMALGGAS